MRRFAVILIGLTALTIGGCKNPSVPRSQLSIAPGAAYPGDVASFEQHLDASFDSFDYRLVEVANGRSVHAGSGHASAHRSVTAKLERGRGFAKQPAIIEVQFDYGEDDRLHGVYAGGVWIGYEQWDQKIVPELETRVAAALYE